LRLAFDARAGAAAASAADGLAVLGLAQHVAHDSSQTTRGVELNFERLRREKLMNTRNPKTLDCVEIGDAVSMELIEKRNIFAHIADAAAARPSALRRQDAGDAMSVKNRLNSPFSEA
jgi:hypothetical protein